VRLLRLHSVLCGRLCTHVHRSDLEARPGLHVEARTGNLSLFFEKGGMDQYVTRWYVRQIARPITLIAILETSKSPGLITTISSIRGQKNYSAQLTLNAMSLYGASPYEILDISYPRVAHATRSPVAFFMHGGGGREGHPYHYGFIAKRFIERGVIFISAGYRLLPHAFYPERLSSVIRGLSWTFANIEDRGGNPYRIYLAGHSAGPNSMDATLEVVDPRGAPFGEANGQAWREKMDLMVAPGRPPASASPWTLSSWW
jgi:hypothetical protein